MAAPMAVAEIRKACPTECISDSRLERTAAAFSLTWN